MRKEIRRTFAGSSRTWMVSRKKRYTPLKRMWEKSAVETVETTSLVINSDANVVAVAATG